MKEYITISIEDLIDTNEIKTIFAMISTQEGVRRELKNTVSAVKLQCALKWGNLSIESVLEYAQKLSEDFTPEKRFQHEAEFSLLAVVLEEDESDLASQFLRDLAGVQVAEMPMSPRVATLCLAPNLKKSSKRGRSYNGTI